MKKLLSIILFLLTSIGTGLLASLFTQNAEQVYRNLNLPPFAPPENLFPIIWSALYLLMGVSAYLVYKNSQSFAPLKIYWVQLVINFFWGILFFTLEQFWLSFLWIVFLLLLILKMIQIFWKENKQAAYLQIPYFLWVAFATILNLAIAILN